MREHMMDTEEFQRATGRSVKDQNRHSEREPLFVIQERGYGLELGVIICCALLVWFEVKTYGISKAIEWLASWLVEL